MGAATTLEVTPANLTTALTTYYTVSANKTCKQLYFVMCNYGAAAANVTIHFVPSGGSNNAATHIWEDSISSKRTVTFDPTIFRGANSILQASASANNTISLAISAVEA